MIQYVLYLLLLVCSSISLLAQDKTSTPKNIILLIGDGMGANQIFAGITANKGHLNIERCTHIGFHKNQASNEFVTDSGAGATAFSIGSSTYNGAIGVDSLKRPQVTILETSENNGKATGLIATSSITHATPASFIAHQPSRKMVEEIALDFLKTDIDVFIGGGRKHFTTRLDGRNLIDELKAKKYLIANSIEEVEKVSTGKLAGFLAEEEQIKISEGRGDQLLKSTQTALKLLGQNERDSF